MNRAKFKLQLRLSSAYVPAQWPSVKWICARIGVKTCLRGNIQGQGQNLGDQDKHSHTAIFKNQDEYFKHQNLFMMNKISTFFKKTGSVHSGGLRYAGVRDKENRNTDAFWI